jgi:transcriptional regulator with XRE-family HTH domain
VEKLKTYLTAADLTQGEFARAIGVSQPTVSDWINDEIRPSVDNLIAISRLTGMSIDDLVADFDKTAA